MAQLEVMATGLLSMLVDAGRMGVQELGFSGAGPMDPESYRLGNWLCGNADNTPAIEILGEARFTASDNMTVAVCGPPVEVFIEGKTQPAWQTLLLKAGQTLSVKGAVTGQRYYLSVAAQWQVPKVAGSACTVLREKLGGLQQNGSALKPSDAIALSLSTHNVQRKIPTALRPDFDIAKPIDIIPGYQEDKFSAVAKAKFYSADYEVTPQSDRMGMRLAGAAVASTIKGMRSEGINFGSVQVPSDGQPIIMLADRQTLGGYPKLGVVASYDIHRVAQAVAGNCIRFNPIDANNARSRWLLRQAQLNAFFQE